jgi:hypothetical protein
MIFDLDDNTTFIDIDSTNIIDDMYKNDIILADSILRFETKICILDDKKIISINLHLKTVSIRTKNKFDF